jgi:hypothetical protein
MTREECEFYKKFRDDMRFILMDLIQFIDTMKPEGSFGAWELLTTLTAFCFAVMNDEDTVYEVNRDCDYILNGMFDPKPGFTDDGVDKFWKEKFVEEFWREFFDYKVQTPKFNIYTFIDDPEVQIDWDKAYLKNLCENVIAEFEMNTTIIEFVSVVFFYIDRMHGCGSKFFDSGKCFPKTTAKDLSLALVGHSIPVSVSNIDIIEKCFRDLTLDLNGVADSLIIGRDSYKQYGLDASFEVPTKFVVCGNPCRARTLLMAAIAAGTPFEVKTEKSDEDEYRDKAAEYLRGIEYISEDEIEGILDSHFINYPPAKAYEVITKTF